MTTPTKVTSPSRTRKTKSTTSSPKVVRNIFYIHKNGSEEPTKDRVKNFLDRLSDEHHDVVCDYLDVLCGRNTRNEDTSESGEVIPFPVGGKRGVQIAKEA